MTHGDPASRRPARRRGAEDRPPGLQPIYDFLESNQEQAVLPLVRPDAAASAAQSAGAAAGEIQGQDRVGSSSPSTGPMCEWWDETCGELLGYLDKQGLAENTLVVYVDRQRLDSEPAQPMLLPPEASARPTKAASARRSCSAGRQTEAAPRRPIARQLDRPCPDDPGGLRSLAGQGNDRNQPA